MGPAAGFPARRSAPGGRWADHRVVINGIFFRTRSGCPWRDLPEGFGNWKTVYNRHRRWSGDGPGRRSWTGCGPAAMRPRGEDWTVSAGSTVVRAHQHAAGARRALPADLLTGGSAECQEPADPAGPGGAGPLARRAEHQDPPGRGPALPPGQPDPQPGQHGDGPQFIPLMQAIRVARRGLGRPRTRPGAALADKACSSTANRAYLRKRGIKTVIPVKEDQKKHRRARGRAGAPPPAFDAGRYKERNTVERCLPSSSSSAPSRPGTTSASSSTRAPSTSRRSGSGCEIPFHDPRDTSASGGAPKWMFWPQTRPTGK
jgi:transposase